jgi:hypothetical protein
MPYSEEFGLTVHGTGKSNREVVLNEIKEMMKEVNGLANSLRALEALVLSKPDTGVLRVRAGYTAPHAARSGFDGELDTEYL